MHLTDMQLREILQSDYPVYDSPRNESEAHLEVCEECSRRLCEMRRFHEDIGDHGSTEGDDK